MSIRRRKEYTDHFLIMDRRALEDKRLSWAARGLLAYLLTKPDSWEVSVAHLMKEGEAGRDKIYSLLKELTTYGYAERGRKRSKEGKLGAVEYVITDFPPNTANTEQEPLPALPDTALPDTANPTQVSTDTKQVLNYRWGPTPEGVDPQAWAEWAEYKRGTPAKATLTKAANFLRQYPADVQRQIVDQSIRNTWKGLFPPPKEQSNGTGNARGVDARRQRLANRHTGQSQGGPGVVSTQ